MAFNKPILPPLHQAVVDDDLAFVQREKNNPRLTLSRDVLGFTAKELALLLDKRAYAKELGYVYPAAIQMHGIDKKFSLPLHRFEEEFHLKYSPTITFPNYAALSECIKQCPLSFLYTPLGMVMRQKGRLLKDGLLKEASCSVRFIDQDVGFGLFTEKFLSPGDYIGEYAGTLTKIEPSNEQDSTYMLHYPTRFFSLNTYAIDAKSSSNLARFINHSEFPNLSPEFLLDRGLLHTAFYANRKILPNEELTVDYGKDYWTYRERI